MHVTLPTFSTLLLFTRKKMSTEALLSTQLNHIPECQCLGTE